MGYLSVVSHLRDLKSKLYQENKVKVRFAASV